MATSNRLSWIILKTRTKKSIPLTPINTTRVAKIDTGWLFKFRHFHGKSSSLTTQAMIFIPDPGHKWNPENHTGAWERISKKGNPNFGEYTGMLKIDIGTIYKDEFFNGSKELHISLAYVP
jgi:hypothetical protein